MCSKIAIKSIALKRLCVSAISLAASIYSCNLYINPSKSNIILSNCSLFVFSVTSIILANKLYLFSSKFISLHISA